jgi:hypothetical protein
MLRIGIMLDSFKTSAWVAKIIEDIQNSEFARIELVILNTPVPTPRPSLKKRLENHWKLTLFHRYEQWDYQRHRSDADAKASRDVSPLLTGIPCIQVNPIRKGFTDRFTEDDLTTIRSSKLDVLFRFGFRIIRGEILNTARYGVWSYHHDDNQEYRGGPPLFWEIYEQNPVSGTVLQILTDSLDGGRVIYRSHSATDFTSLYRSRNPIYWKTSEFALRRLRDLHTKGWSFIESLPTYNEVSTYSRRIYKTPNARQMAIFISQLIRRKLGAIISSRLHGGFKQWFVAIRKRTSDHSFDTATNYQIIRPPRDRFYADPFLTKKSGATYLFLEDYRYKEARALISYCKVDSDGTPGEFIEVLRRPYHLSYPFLFEHDGQMYMIPETKENRTVELYRAENFPDRWILHSVLLENVFAADATIHQTDGKFWMFVAISNGKYSNCDELDLFYADSPFGPWTPHPNNPIVSDVRRARPAGALFYKDGKLIRPSQDCSKAYGYALCFSEIVILSETDYREVPVSKLTPEWTSDNLGTHTYTSTEEFEVIDGNFAAKISKNAM